MLAQGADVLVLDAVDTVAAVSIVVQAQRLGVPVIAYDRFVRTATDYYVSFDYEFIGFLQGSALVRERAAGRTARRRTARAYCWSTGRPPTRTPRRSRPGPPTPSTAPRLDVLAEYDTPDWSPDKAQEWVTGQLTQYPGRSTACSPRTTAPRVARSPR